MDAQIALDNLEQLLAMDRARVLDTIVRNAVRQAEDNGAITWLEFAATIKSACEDMPNEKAHRREAAAGDVGMQTSTEPAASRSVQRPC